MKNLGKTLLFSGVLALTSAIVINCGGGGGGSSTSSSGSVSVGGQLGQSYSYYKKHFWDYFIPRAYAAFGKVKKIYAYPYVGGEIIYDKIKEIDVNPDGTFNVNLEKTATDPETGNQYNLSWILLVEKTDGSLDFISLSTTDNDSLINLPIYSVSANNVDLGTLENSSDEARSKNLDVDSFANVSNLDTTTLYNFAKNDDFLKSLYNFHKNNYGKNENDFIIETLHVVVSGNYNNLSSDYTIANNFQGYAIHFQGGSNTLLAKNFNNICKTNKYLSLNLPNGKSVKDGSGNTYTKLESSNGTIRNRTDGGKECEGTNFYARLDANGDITLNFITGDTSTVLLQTKPIPDGLWTLKVNGTKVYEGKLSYNLPLYSNGTLKSPVPKVKLDLDSNNEVLGAYIEWYVYNPQTSNYEKADTEALKSLIGNYSIHFDDFNGINGNNNRLEVACDNLSFNNNYIDFNKDCKNYPSSGVYYNYNNEDKYSLDDLNVVIIIGNTEIRYTYRK